MPIQNGHIEHLDLMEVPESKKQFVNNLCGQRYYMREQGTLFWWKQHNTATFWIFNKYPHVLLYSTKIWVRNTQNFINWGILVIFESYKNISVISKSFGHHLVVFPFIENKLGYRGGLYTPFTKILLKCHTLHPTRGNSFLSSLCFSYFNNQCIDASLRRYDIKWKWLKHISIARQYLSILYKMDFI